MSSAQASTANDAELPILRSYGDLPRDSPLDGWARSRLEADGPYRPRFMVYSGLGTPELTAERLEVLQQVGAESFLIATDLPSQLGFDPDDELAFAQVGRAGVSCATLDDFATLCSRIDLQRADSIGLLANSVGHIGLGMIDCVLRDRGARHVKLVMQNDPLKEFTARGTEIFTPPQALRIACDTVAYAIDEQLPGAAITVCSNHLDVAGAGPVLALAIALANAQEYVDELVARGYSPTDVLDSMMFFLNERSDLFAGAALFRCARELWAEIVRERYGVPVREQPVMRLMGYAHGLESADEPLVNLPRIALSALAAMLGGVDYLCASAYDEALRIPSVDAAALAVRTMQVTAHEHGTLTSIDPLRGSAKLNALESEIRERVRHELATIADLGGGLAAMQTGWVQARIDEFRGTRQRQLEEGDRDMVGRTIYQAPALGDLFAGRSAGEMDFEVVEKQARQRLEQHRARRSAATVAQALGDVEDAAAGTANVVPPTVAALRAGATAGEIVAATRQGFER